MWEELQVGGDWASAVVVPQHIRKLLQPLEAQLMHAMKGSLLQHATQHQAGCAMLSLRTEPNLLASVWSN
jgi:hypothetical protein